MKPDNIERYVIPGESGLFSTSAAVGRRIGKVLDSLETLSWAVCEGEITDDTRNLKAKMIDRLRAEGWRVSINGRDRWQVLPPKRGK